jgi:type II secretory pathway component PulM
MNTPFQNESKPRKGELSKSDKASTSLGHLLNPVLKPIQDWISGRSVREQLLIKASLFLISLYVIFFFAIAPALDSLHKSAAKAQVLDRQWGELLGMQSELKSIKSLPVMDAVQASEKLQTLTTQLGPLNKITLQDTSARLQLKGVSPESLGEFLPELRKVAQAQVLATNLRLDSQTKLWEGSITVSLPSAAFNH